MLQGMRVIDLTRYFPGPFATLRLEERGAEVIKIEDKQGDPGRYMDMIDGKEGTVFRSVNRGKKSVALNLKEDADREKLLELVETADVFLESFRPGVAKRLGIDYQTLSIINPEIVYVSMTGFGQNTSIANLASHDINYLSMCGFLDQLLDSHGKPIMPTIAIADLVSGIVASEAVLAAYIKRLKTGKGTYIDLSMTDAVASMMQLMVTKCSADGGEHGVGGMGLGKGVFETKDNRYMVMCAVESKFFANFCTAVGKKHLIPFQKESAAGDNPHYAEIIALFRERSFAEWCKFAEVVDCCMTPVLHVSELKESNYFKERGLIENRWGLDYITTLTPPKAGFLGFDRPYPELGADNYIILEQ